MRDRNWTGDIGVGGLDVTDMGLDFTVIEKERW